MGPHKLRHPRVSEPHIGAGVAGADQLEVDVGLADVDVGQQATVPPGAFMTLGQADLSRSPLSHAAGVPG